MSDKELNELMDKYERYKLFGEKMEYSDFAKLFDELYDRHAAHRRNVEYQKVLRN